MAEEGSRARRKYGVELMTHTGALPIEKESL